MAWLALLLVPPGTERERLQAQICAVRPGAQVLPSAATAAAEGGLNGHHPKIAIVDVDVPERSTGPALEHLVRDHRGCPVVALSAATDAASIERALSAGACGYLPKSYTDEQVELVLRLVLTGAGYRPVPAVAIAGQEPAAPIVVPLAPETAQPGAPPDGRLTPKQIEVLAYAGAGLSNKQIAAKLGISLGTTKLHMTAILRKLNVERRSEAIVLARRMAEVQQRQVQQGQRGDLVLDSLLPHVSHRRMRAGEVIFRKGDPGRELFYLQRGEVLLEEIGVEMTRGEIFGEIGVFAPEHARTCTARCKTDCELFCLDSEQVKNIYYQNPQFALRIVTLLAQRMVAERMQ